MDNKKDNTGLNKKSDPKFNNDQLGENASNTHADRYDNKGANAKGKRR